MIELRGVSRTHHLGEREVTALRDVDLAIGAGEHVAVTGPSGSGKSTLLNIIGCLDRPTAGTYLLGGRDVGRLSDDELSGLRSHRIGFVFQMFHLVPRLTALANVELPMVFAGTPRPERAERARRALDAVGLTDRADHRPDQLSGGERQRVCIARAVVMRPAVLLADEPTGNLDSASGTEVMGLLGSLHASGLTLVVVTHDPGIASRAPRRIQLADGRVVSDARTP